MDEMDRQDILNATPEELNRLVAEQRGECYHEFVDCRPIGYSHYGPNMVCRYCHKSLSCGETEPNPDWSGDIAVAWQLLEDMVKHRYWVNVLSPSLRDSSKLTDTQWSVSLLRGTGLVYGNAAPEAICRAWLMSCIDPARSSVPTIGGL